MSDEYSTPEGKATLNERVEKLERLFDDHARKIIEIAEAEADKIIAPVMSTMAEFGFDDFDPDVRYTKAQMRRIVVTKRLADAGFDLQPDGSILKTRAIATMIMERRG